MTSENKLDNMVVGSGRVLKDNGTAVNAADLIESINANLGTAVESPPVYTLAARLKALLTGIILSESTAVIGKVGIDQTAGQNIVAIDKGIIQNAFAVVPNDDADFAQSTIALYVGVEGDVKVNLVGTGAAIILKGLAAGVWHPIAVSRVYAIGTNATDIVGAY